MKILLTCFLFFMIDTLQGQNYLLTHKNDSIYIQGELQTNHPKPDRWTKLTANGTTYRLREIKCLQYEADFFLNIRRRLWKRVVNGKINVYARNDRDTIPGRKGNWKKVLFIQRDSDYPALEYNYSNLLRVLSNDSLRRFAQRKVSSQKAAKSIMISGIATLGVTGIGTVFSVAFGDLDLIKTNGYIRAGIFFLAGFGNIIAAGKIKNTSGKMSLSPIYFYNIK